MVGLQLAKFWINANAEDSFLKKASIQLESPKFFIEVLAIPTQIKVCFFHFFSVILVETSFMEGGKISPFLEDIMQHLFHSDFSRNIYRFGNRSFWPRDLFKNNFFDKSQKS